MEADWYVDPLGRYEGRYFDGETWTERVKDRGQLALDPDWGRPEMSTAVGDPGSRTIERGPLVGAVVTETADAGPVFAPELAAPTADSLTAGEASTHQAGFGFHDHQHAAVAQLDAGPKRQVGAAEIDCAVESPAVRVAVLEDLPAPTPDLGEAEEFTFSPSANKGAARSNDVYRQQVPNQEVPLSEEFDQPLPREPDQEQPGQPGIEYDQSIHQTAIYEPIEQPESSIGWRLVLAASVLALGLLFVLLPRLLGSTARVEPSAPIDPDRLETVPAAETAEQQELPDGQPLQPDPGEGSSPSEPADQEPASEPEFPDAVEVGGLTILNGKPVIAEMEEWHASVLAAQPRSLTPDAGCWFGTIDGAIVQNVHCGPYEPLEEGLRFDVIPLLFEDVSERVVQVRPSTDDIVVGSGIPVSLQLIGADGPIDQASFGTEPDGDRGARQDGD